MDKPATGKVEEGLIMITIGFSKLYLASIQGHTMSNLIILTSEIEILLIKE